MEIKEFKKQLSKSKTKRSETALQIGCVKWFRLQYPEYRDNLVHVPNEGKRTTREGGKLKEMGLVAGVADLFLMCSGQNYCGLWIEIKTETGVQSENQKRFEWVCHHSSFKYALVRSFDEFQRVIKWYLGY